MSTVSPAVMALSLSPAAVCQCFSLVSLCTSIADPNWIEVRNDSTSIIYGVSFVLHPQQNLTDTGPLGGMHSWGLWLLYALTFLCYAAVLFSSTSFFADFLGSSRTWPRLTSLLHFCTAVFCVAVLCVCGTCLYVVSLNLQKLTGRLVWDGAEGEALTKGVQISAQAGESFYFAVLASVFSITAFISSFHHATQTASREGYEPIETDDTISESSSVREQEVGDQGLFSGQMAGQSW